MQKALEIIQKHAKELKKLEQSEQHLFEVFNNKSLNEVGDLIREFGFVQ